MGSKEIRKQLPYVLVAEASLIPLIRVVVLGLLKHANPASITLIAPEHDVDAFIASVGKTATVISERAVLPDWPLERVRDRLAQQNRAGWYLQQFLKLSFGQFIGAAAYVIWDADTVPISRPVLREGQTTLFCTAPEHNPPYFETYRRLLHMKPTLKQSVISQYMHIETPIAVELQSAIMKNTGSTSWIDAVLNVLPGKGPSEFSEYETYANFFAATRPALCRTVNLPWFRYGAEIYPDFGRVTLEELERRFIKYRHVAFERHPDSLRRRIAAYAKLSLGI